MAVDFDEAIKDWVGSSPLPRAHIKLKKDLMN
jgi:hypothetical protein